MKEKYTESTIQIKATPAKVWEVLTSSDFTPHYMFNCLVETDWIPGSRIAWTGKEDKVLYVDGQVVSFEPYQLIVYTTIDPSGKYPDEEGNYLTVEYHLEETENGTYLVIKQGDYNVVANGKERYEESMSFGGWDSIIKEIKQLSEKN